MTRKSNAQKIARRTGLVAAVASLALAVAPAAGMAKAPVKFGAKLNSTVQPSNSLPGLTCNGPETALEPCTMVLNEAYGRPDGGEFAPKTGTIKKIRLIAGGPGSFRLMAVKKINGTDAIAKRYGQRISYTGQVESAEEEGDYRVESFPVEMKIKKGEQLALRGSITSMIRCSSGGDNTLIYTPPLFLGGSFTPATNTDGCWLLMEAMIR
ncbi:MAG: hypothetical protein QOF13_1113 [Solirubrobacterales bacterium]|jgi:hypothetical protein|nr:hypothetical protein [Solirubrobacterales bacterium]